MAQPRLCWYCFNNSTCNDPLNITTATIIDCGFNMGFENRTCVTVRGNNSLCKYK